MTLVSHTEVLTIGEVRCAVGEEIAATPDAILALQGLQNNRVLVARELTKDGDLATMPERTPPNPCPIYPSPEEKAADPQAVEKYNEAFAIYDEQKRNQQPPAEIPKPAQVGYPRAIKSSTYFVLDRLGTNVPSFLPLETPDRSRTAFYRFHIAEIVE